MTLIIKKYAWSLVSICFRLVRRILMGLGLKVVNTLFGCIFYLQVYNTLDIYVKYQEIRVLKRFMTKWAGIYSTPYLISFLPLLLI